MRTRGDDDLDLVVAARDGDPTAFGALFDRWFDRVFDVSFRILHDREVAAEVAQDVFLVAWQQLATLRQPESFGGWLLRTSRNRSLNRLERERRSVALGDEETMAVIDRRSTSPDASVAAAQGEDVDLVWAAAAALGERDASVLDLHLRHGFGAPEIAEALDVTTNNAHQLLFRLKDRLRGAVRGWVLWADGAPSCPSLARALAVAGIDTFGAEAVKAIDRHARACDVCEERRALRLAPEAMFAAVPLAVAGPFLRTQAASALSGAGVPMSGSTALGGAGAVSTAAVVEGDGPGDAHDGHDGGGSLDEYTADDEGSPAVRRATRLHAVMAIVALVVVLGTVVAIADSVGDGSRELATAPVDATASTSSSTSSSTSTSAVTTTTALDVAVPPPPPPAQTVPDPVPPVADPTPTPTPTDPTPPPPPPPPPPTAPAPTIGRFSATQPSGASPCLTPSEEWVLLVWNTTDAGSVTIAGPGAPSGTQPAAGRLDLCLPPGSSAPFAYVLTATGPGGSTRATSTTP